jgi:anti-anti-sigma regulatory factor
MLKITMHETPHRITLKLEGSLIGAWVAELEDVWRAAASNGTGRPIYLDVAAVDAIDAAGRYLLLLISDRGTQMIGSGGRELDGLIEIVEGWRHEKDS